MITITGRLATEPDTKRVGSHNEHLRTELIILENTGRMTRDGWQADSEPTRHVVYAWRELGERAASLNTGDAVIIVGREYTTSWTDRETGEKRRRRVVDADDIGPSLREMQVQTRRPRKPGLDEEAAAAWVTHATAEPSVRTALTDDDIIQVMAALDERHDEQAHRASIERDNQIRNGRPGDSPMADLHTTNAEAAKSLSERITALLQKS